MITLFAGSLSQGSLTQSLRVKGQLDEEVDAAGEIVACTGWLTWQDSVDLATETDYRLDLDDGSFHDIRTTSIDNSNRRADFLCIS